MENNFFSMDRLIEFGLSMAVAQQMVNTMNQTMQNMYVPGAQNAMAPMPSQVYYAVVDGCQVGPLSEADLTKLIVEHKINKDTNVWMPGMNAWQTAEKVPQVMRLVALSPPPFDPQKNG